MKSQDRDVERKNGKKGNRRAEAITERLAGGSFDGLACAVDPAHPPKSGAAYWRTLHCVPGCHLNQSRGGFENGPPTGGDGVTCPAHTIDVASQVSTETWCLCFKIGGDSELQGSHLWALRIVWGGANGQEGTSGQNGPPLDLPDGVRNARRIPADEPPPVQWTSRGA